jgi:S1-C subfamily serine protease
MSSPSSESSWACPQCGRRVPAYVRECRCGLEKPEEALLAARVPAAKPVSGGGPARLASVLLLSVAVAGIVIAAAMYVNRAPARPESANRTRANAPAPIPVSHVPPADDRQSGSNGDTTPSAAPAADTPGARLSLPESEAFTHARESTPAPRSRSLSIEDVVSMAEPAVAVVDAGTSRGTGFFIGPDTLLTNVHVVQGRSSVTVRLSGDVTLLARVERTLPDVDLALLKTDRPHPRRAALELGTVESVRPGQEVIAIGAPLGLQSTATRGIVSAVRHGRNVVLIQTDAAINPGNSGGPLLDRSARVIGINTMTVRSAESLGFAVAVDHAMALLSNSTAPTVTIPRDAPAIAMPSAASKADQQRQDGQAAYDKNLLMLARQAEQIDAAWEDLQRNCLVNPLAAGDGQRAWFVLRDTPATFQAADMWCTSRLGQILGVVRAFSSAMQEAGEQARRAGVYPGIQRETRRKYRLDWTGWDR